jgi:hypothetical protein
MKFSLDDDLIRSCSMPEFAKREGKRQKMVTPFDLERARECFVCLLWVCVDQVSLGLIWAT